MSPSAHGSGVLIAFACLRGGPSASEPQELSLEATPQVGAYSQRAVFVLAFGKYRADELALARRRCQTTAPANVPNLSFLGPWRLRAGGITKDSKVS